MQFLYKSDKECNHVLTIYIYIYPAGRYLWHLVTTVKKYPVNSTSLNHSVTLYNILLEILNVLFLVIHRLWMYMIHTACKNLMGKYCFNIFICVYLLENIYRKQILNCAPISL